MPMLAVTTRSLAPRMRPLTCGAASIRPLRTSPPTATAAAAAPTRAANSRRVIPCRSSLLRIGHSSLARHEYRDILAPPTSFGCGILPGQFTPTTEVPMHRQSLGVALLLLLVTTAAAHAQTPSGEISGTVTDSSALPVPGVTISLTNQATNAVRVVQTNEVGLYVIS